MKSSRQSRPQVLVEVRGAIKKEVRNEKKMFISFALHFVYSLLDSLSIPRCVLCSDASAMGCQTSFSARHRRVEKSGRTAAATSEIPGHILPR
jgi:hypothetical protein